MPELRPYQGILFDRVREAYHRRVRRVLMVLPTGGGKTILFCAITEGAAAKGKRIWILAHRIELIDQITASLEQFGIEPDVLAPRYKRRTSHVLVASVMSLVRKLDKVEPPDLIIADEAHHVAKTHDGENSWGRIFARFPQALHLGVTATPMRTDGRGLGEFFDEMVIGPDVAALTAAGYLAPCRVFAPPTVDTSGLQRRAGEFKHEQSEALVSTRAITGDALAHYRKHADGKRALIFAVSVAHAEAIAAQFRESGYQALHLHGGTAKDVRRGVVNDFHEGRLQVLASCDLFSEGFDCPGAEVGIMLRPTMSMGLFRQQCGRILRAAPGKTAILLDHVANTTRFGLPSDPMEWSLEMDARERKPGLGIKVCPECWAAIAQSESVCPECGHEFSGGVRGGIEEREGELVEVDTANRKCRRCDGEGCKWCGKEPPNLQEELARAETLEQLKKIGRRRGYKAGWAEHVWLGKKARGAAPERQPELPL